MPVRLKTLNLLCTSFLVTVFASGGYAQDWQTGLQQFLQERGCYSGKIDGNWGPGSNRALSRFEAAVGKTIATPVDADALAKLNGETTRRCETLAHEGLSPSAAAKKIAADSLQGWPREEMIRTANADAKYCELGPWNTGWLGPQDNIKLSREIILTGEDLARYRRNVDPVSAKLDRLNARVAVDGSTAELKQLMLDLADNEYFTVLRPYRPTRWEGGVPEWIGWYAKNVPEAEPAFAGATLMLPASVSLSLIEPDLTEAERKKVLQWGRKLFQAVNGAKRTLINVDNGNEAPDIRAMLAAAFTAWGAAAKDTEIFRRGAVHYEKAVAAIRPDGTERFFVGGSWGGVGQGIELKYQNFAYGLISIAAHNLRRNGIDAYEYRTKMSGSLIDGLKFHLAATFDPAQRKRMGANQVTDYSYRTRAEGEHSFSYLEFVNADSVIPADAPDIKRALANRELGRPSGFYGGFFAGYTTCLFGKL